MTIPAELSTQVSVPEGIIDFGIGQPQMASLPLEALRTAAAHRLAQGDRDWLNYGAEAGDGPFRQVLAEWLTRGYGLPISAENLFITGGASHGLTFLCNRLTKPGDTIFVEEPSYFLALDIFRDHHLNLVSIATDEGGLIPDALREAVEQHTAVFLYTIPTFHNPTGRSISAERRAEIVTIAQQNDLLVVADEVYQLLSFDAQPPTSFAAWLDTGVVISIGSFSKIMAPALRLGWLICHPDRQAYFAASGVTVSGGGFNHFTANIMRSAIEQGIQDAALAQLRKRYRTCANALDAALHTHLPPSVAWHNPQGGFFFWLTLEDGRSAVELRAKSDAFGVRFHPGVLFSAEKQLANTLRLSFAFYDPDELSIGAQNLAALLTAQ